MQGLVFVRPHLVLSFSLAVILSFYVLFACNSVYLLRVKFIGVVCVCVYYGEVALLKTESMYMIVCCILSICSQGGVWMQMWF